MLCLWESTCFEGLVYVFNVQHLYFACLDEGKIKNSEPCLYGIWFSLPAIYFFFSVHNSTLPVRCLHFASVCEMLIVSSL